MNDQPEKHEHRSGKDAADEMAGDSWGQSGSTGAPAQGEQDLRGDRRTHDWEVGDRNYAGTEAQRGQGKDRSFTSEAPDKGKPDVRSALKSTQTVEAPPRG